MLGSWHFVGATVVETSLSASSIERGGMAPAVGVSGAGGAERVWVKMKFNEAPGEAVLPGMSARGWISVR